MFLNTQLFNTNGENPGKKQVYGTFAQVKKHKNMKNIVKQIAIITYIQGKIHAITVSLTEYNCAIVLEYKAATQLQTVKKCYKKTV